MAGRGVDFGRRSPQEHELRMRVDLTIRGQRGSRVKSVWVRTSGLTSAAALLALSLAGCAALGGKPAPLDTFELSAPSIDAHGHSRRQILIAQPSALKALDSQNIVIKPSDRSIQYLKGAQWADRLPLIVQARLAETFQRSGSFAGVGKLYLISRKFLPADGGLGRMVWMPKDLKDSLHDQLNERGKEEGFGDNFADMIADETVGTTPDEIMPFLEEKGHPALKMDPMF